MNEPLTPDRVAALLPALGQLAEATAQRGALDPADLSLLQMGLGLDDAWAADELRRWADILGAARQPGRQDMAVRALTLRGVPEEAATRAVATAAAGVAAAATSAAETTAWTTPTPGPAAEPAPTPSRSPWPLLLGLLGLLLLVGLGSWWLSRAGATSNQAAAAPTSAPTSAPTRVAIVVPPTAPAAYPSPSRVPAAVASVPPTAAAKVAPPAATGVVPTASVPPTVTRIAASPTPIPPTRTPRPRATLTAAAAACQPGVGQTFTPVWSDLGLHAATGCPTSVEKAVITAYAPFEKGFMIWREDNRQIYAVYDDGTFEVFADTWKEGDPEYSCTDTNTPNRTPPTPGRGIGKAWCAEPGVRARLGNVKADENGNLRAVQDFERGVGFGIGERDPAVFILQNDTRRWSAG